MCGYTIHHNKSNYGPMQPLWQVVTELLIYSLHQKKVFTGTQAENSKSRGWDLK